MSRPKDPLRYPAFCLATARQLSKTPSKPIEFPCRDMAEARNFKLTFNSFKKAALDAGWNLPGQPTMRVDVSGLANMIVRIIEDAQGIRAEVSHIDYDPAVSRWNKVVGVMPIADIGADDDDEPAYANRQTD